MTYRKKAIDRINCIRANAHPLGLRKCDSMLDSKFVLFIYDETVIVNLPCLEMVLTR